MRGMRFVSAVVLIGLVCCSARSATVINDGQTHTLDSASADIFLAGASTLNVETGANVKGAMGTGNPGAIPPSVGIRASGAGTTLNIADGVVAGGDFNI